MEICDFNMEEILVTHHKVLAVVLAVYAKMCFIYILHVLSKWNVG